MRSPSEPEPSESKEHSMLDAVEASYVVADERRARCKLLEEAEANMREGNFPDLYPRRCRNMQLLFDLLRQSRVPLPADFWLEARLLRLMDKHDQCRQLCQSRPMYDWTFDVLQEFVWASRGDPYPYERRKDFNSDGDKVAATQLYGAAKTLHDAKCYQWQQAHDAAAKPAPKEARASQRTEVGSVITLVACALAWYFYSGWAAFVVFLIFSTLLFVVFSDGKDMVHDRMTLWAKDNPKPQAMALTLHHQPLPRVYISPF